MNFIWYIIIAVLLIIVLYLYNEAPWLWTESSAYQKTDSSRLMDSSCSSRILQSAQSKAVLCLHGFPATPSNFQYIIPLLQEDYDVYAPLLPGMGSSPSDMRHQTYSGWYAFARGQYLELCEKYEQVYLLGISMGASLCLELAQEFSHSDKYSPTAIALASAPVFLNSFLENGVMHRPALYLSRLLKNLLPPVLGQGSANKYTEDNAGAWQGYHGIFLPQIHSLKMGLKTVKKNLHRVKCPAYLCHSRGDRTVPYANMDTIFRHISSDYVEKRTVDTRPFQHTHHVLFIYDSVRDSLFHDIICFYKNAAAKERS